MPRRCRVAPEDEVLRCDLRQLLYGNYRILFTVSDATRTVFVLHVRHAARQSADSAELEGEG